MNHEYVRVAALLGPHSPNRRIRKSVRKIWAKAEAERRALSPAALTLLEDLERRHTNALLFGDSSPPHLGPATDVYYAENTPIT